MAAIGTSTRKFANVKAGNIHAFTFTLDSDAVLSHP